MKILAILLGLSLSWQLMADTIKEVGKIDYDKASHTYFFYFIKDNKIKSIVIKPTNKAEDKELQANIGKAVVLDGEIKEYASVGEKITFREEVNTSRIQSLNAELLKIDTKKILTQYNLLSHEKKPKKINSTIAISDKAANGIIAVAGAVIGIAAGPISLLPVSAYLLNEGVNSK